MMLLQETKQVALATTETLSQQTDQLGGMKGNVEDIDNQLKKSDQLIRAYLVRLMTDHHGSDYASCDIDCCSCCDLLCIHEE